MLLTPRYGAPPIVTIEPRAPGAHPILQQRQRLGELLTELTDEEWRHASRCDGWSVQDVVTHLTSTNGFWTLSIQAGLAGEPTRFLGAFDPVASPAELVDQGQGTSVPETRDAYLASTAALADVVDALAETDWDTLAEAPPGHLPIWLVADHALWDGWVHERDITVPLGRPAVVEPDEVLTCLRYGAALGRAFEVCGGSSVADVVALEVRDPDAELVVSLVDGVVRVDDGPAPADAERGSGDAVAILEMLSMRDAGAPVPAAVRSLTTGLAVVFDQPASV